MQEKIYSIDEAKKIIKNKLPDFLKESGIEEGKKNFFRSFYGDTDDSNPSLHIFVNSEGEYLYHDFSTGRNGDIFVANHVLNQAPLFGKEFITDNLKPLAEKYGIRFEFRALTEEEEHVSKIKGVYRAIKDLSMTYLLMAMKTDTIDEAIKEYMQEKDLYTPQSVRKYSLGWIPNWDDFEQELIGLGASRDFLKSIGVKRFLFNNTNLIFNVLDHKSRVKSFIARNCYFNKEDRSTSKYYNIENNAWSHKSSLLYNINNAFARRKDGYVGPIYITEGPTDAIQLDKVGLKSVAVGSLNFNQDHIAVLQSIDEADVVFVLDGDAPGRHATRKIIFEVLDGVRAFKVRVVELPDKYDPSSFIIENGRGALTSLPHKTAFSYKLEILQETSDLKGHDLAKEIVPLIVNEPSAIERDAMSGILAEASDLPIDVIRREVNRLVSANQGRIELEKDAIINSVIKGLKVSPKDAGLILESAHRQLVELDNEHSQNQMSIEYQLEEIMSIEERGEESTDKHSIKLSRMPKFQSTIDGDLIGTFIVIGGQPNAGKSTFLYNIIRSALEFGEEKNLGWDLDYDGEPNDMSIILHTVDDSIEQVVPKIVTILANNFVKRITISEVTNINRIKYDIEQKLSARKRGYSIVRQWIKEGRLIVKDASSGARLTDGLRFIREYKTRYPDRMIVYMVDNMYNLNDFSDMEETHRIGKIANALAVDIAETEKITVFATVEYRKMSNVTDATSNIALNEMIKEAKTIEYRANWIGHLLNEMHSNPEKTNLFFYDNAIPVSSRKNEYKSPVVLLRITKNKITSKKITIPYLFFHERAIQVEVDEKHLSYLNNELIESIKRFVINESDEVDIKIESDFDFIRNMEIDDVDSIRY